MSERERLIIEIAGGAVVCLGLIVAFWLCAFAFYIGALFMWTFI